VASINHEEELRKAELRKVHAEIARLESDRDKIELEKGEIVARNSQKWWNIRASGLIQAVIGGIVAGALVAGFALDHFLKISDLNEKSQKALQIEKKGLIDKATKLETKATLLESEQEKSRQVIIALRNENNKFKTETEETLKRLSELAASASQNNEASLNSEIALLRTELDRAKVKTESRERSLNIELINLAQAQEQISQGNKDNWFPVIASPYNEVDLRGKLKELSQSPLNYPVHVYKTVDKRGTPVYAITFEGYLSKSEADKRIRYARKKGIAKDAYPWSSNIWGVNIVD
jgi:hypothetical protein